MIQIPPGKKARDLLPQYANVTTEYGPIGAPCKLCAGCGKPFTASRKPRMTLKLYPVHSPVPVAYLYRICGQCTHRYRAGGAQRDRVLDAIEKFCMGEGTNS